MFALPPTARHVAAKSVGSFVPTLTRKAFEKFGFSTATLITDWPRIAGSELAGYTLPDRLKWPRGGSNGDDGDEDRRGRSGATLILRVDPARALDVEYRARQIMDRINAYFGYRAVEALRLVQAPIAVQTHRTAARQENSRQPLERQDGLLAPDLTSEDPLAAALARLGRGVMASRTASSR